MNFDNRIYVERILLVCAAQNAGKSRLLRAMLGDERLGGVVPTHGPIPPRSLSRERWLVGRISSPHEMGETTDEFHEKIRSTQFRRVNYFSAVQPRAFKSMPDIIGVCKDLQHSFNPERIRVVVLAPDQAGNLSSALSAHEVDKLRALDVEVLTIDARRGVQPAEPGNVRILADFFDFT